MTEEKAEESFLTMARAILAELAQFGQGDKLTRAQVHEARERVLAAGLLDAFEQGREEKVELWRDREYADERRLESWEAFAASALPACVNVIESPAAEAGKLADDMMRERDARRIRMRTEREAEAAREAVVRAAERKAKELET
jgi:hypothetical protein